MRKVIHSSILIAFVCLVVEGASWAAYYLHAGQSFSFSKIRAELNTLDSVQLEEAKGAGQQTGNVLHPYLGFIHEPSNSNDPAFRVSDFGFLDDRSPIEREEDEVLVAVFGGSVAWWLGLHGAEVIASAVAELPNFQGKKVRVVRVALGAYKQPQQLLAYSYLRSLGAKYDVVINLDGFNEISLPTIGLITRGIYQHYPINWQLLVGTTVTPEQQALIGKLEMAKTSRASLARLFAKAPLSISVTALTVWSMLDAARDGEISNIRQKLAQGAGEANNFPYVISGPKALEPNFEDVYLELVRQWANSSQAMASIAKGDGAYYFHFLQPNQYVVGSKPLSAEEMKNKIAENAQYRDAVEQGYPALIEAGNRLREAGVWFVDLSKIYNSVQETLYVDNCCHLNQRGNVLMAEAMAKNIKQQISTKSVKN